MRLVLIAGLLLTVACGSVPQPAMISRSEEGAEQVRRAEREWNDAIDRRDRAAMESFLAPSYFLAVGVSGRPLQIVPRDRWLQSLDLYDIRSYSFDDMHVNVYGDVAVVTMLFSQDAVVGPQRRDRSAQFFLTDVWVRNGGRWMVAERHSSRPEAAPSTP